MTTHRTIQLVLAGVLAFALNGVAAAQTVHLNVNHAWAAGSVASIGSGPALVANTVPGNTPTFSAASGTTPLTAIYNHDYNHNYSHDYNHNYNKWVSTPPVPEPSDYLMILAGVGLIGFMAFRRRRLHFD